MGVTKEDINGRKAFYREVLAFQGFSIVDFAAGHRSCHVIIAGDKDPTQSLYEHQI